MVHRQISVLCAGAIACVEDMPLGQMLQHLTAISPSDVDAITVLVRDTLTRRLEAVRERPLTSSQRWL